MSNILAFIEQQLAEDEETTQAPRDRRQTAATRAVLRWHDEVGCPECATDVDGCSLLRAVASVWPEVPGYRDYWRP